MAIHIRMVLAKINTYEVGGIAQEFSIKYCTVNGELREYKRLALGGRKKEGNSSGNGGYKYNNKKHGTIPLFNLETEKTITLKIAGIMEFNGETVLY